jgi:hypothetical protein
VSLQTFSLLFHLCLIMKNTVALPGRLRRGSSGSSHHLKFSRRSRGSPSIAAVAPFAIDPDQCLQAQSSAPSGNGPA